MTGRGRRSNERENRNTDIKSKLMIASLLSGIAIVLEG
jgi:hypothetical protein